MQNIAFPKNQLFPKSNSSEKVDAAQKYLVRKSTSSENVFILNSFSTKGVLIPKSNYPKAPSILKKWLLGRSFPLKKQLFSKNDCYEEATVLKKEAPQKMFQL